MRRRRDASAEQELARLEDAIRDAEAALEEARADVERVAAEKLELDELRADSILGVADPAEVERREAALEVRAAKAEKAVGRQENLVVELKRRAAARAQADADEKLARAEADLAAAERRVVEAEEALAEGQRERDEAFVAVESARSAGEFATGNWDAEVAGRAAEERKRIAEKVRWHAEHPHGEPPPLALVAAVEKERERLGDEHERQRDRIFAEAAATWREAGAEPPFETRGEGEIRQGEGFPRVEA